MAECKTAFDKIWDAHVILRSNGGLDLVHVDRSLLTDLTGTLGLEEILAEGRAVRNPELHVAIPDHAISTGEKSGNPEREQRFVGELARLTELVGMRHWPRQSGRQGIVHVAGLEQAVTLPGMTLVCGDSHTSTHGAIGALAWGIGTTEVKHVLTTQTLWLKKPRKARISLGGTPGPGVTPKDIILWLIGHLGADYGREHAIEFTGPLIENISVEGRATFCNMAIEIGARFGFVAPDQTTLDYLSGRDFAPVGENWNSAIADWQTIATDSGAFFDKDEYFDVSNIGPQISWGISPDQVAEVDGHIPGDAPDAATQYIGLGPGTDLSKVPVDYVFIGSCTNGRIEDLRSAAQVIGDGKVADGVTAWVVPGSEAVAAAARSEGLDQIFINAGFDWRLSGCSMCSAANGDAVPPGKRCVSTSNRNFMGRQGPGSRTHLASPLTAAASAITGQFTDPRSLLEQEGN